MKGKYVDDSPPGEVGQYGGAAAMYHDVDVFGHEEGHQVGWVSSISKSEEK